MEPNKFEGAAELPEPISGGQGDVMPILSPEMQTQPALTTPPSQQPLPQLQPVQPHGQVVIQDNEPSQAVTVPISSTLIADDADLIEKEWVLKAKAIVAQTAHDPNLQTKEVGKVRAEYLMKRYNKALKLDEA